MGGGDGFRGRGRGGFRGRGRGGRGGRSGGAPEGPIDECKLYVGGLSWNVDDAGLQEAFQSYGTCEVSPCSLHALRIQRPWRARMCALAFPSGPLLVHQKTAIFPPPGPRSQVAVKRKLYNGSRSWTGVCFGQIFPLHSRCMRLSTVYCNFVQVCESPFPRFFIRKTTCAAAG